MAWSGSVFSLLYDFVARRDAGSPTNVIGATEVQAQFQDLADGLEACIKANGDIPATANIPMGGFGLTNVAASTLRTQYARIAELQDNTHTWIAGAGTADAITATYAPSVAALTNGLLVGFRASAANATTTPTFAPNGLTAKTIVKGANTALVAGDIAGQYHECLVRYNSSIDKWVLLNPTTGFGNGTTVVNNGGTLEVALPRNAQTGTTYTILTGDRGKHITFSNGSSVAVTLPQAGSAGFLLSWFCYVENLGAGVVTITPATSTINGAATLVLTNGAAQAYLITSDGANYRALPMYAAIDLNALTTDNGGMQYTDLVPFVDSSESNASNKASLSVFTAGQINQATSGTPTGPTNSAYDVLTRNTSDATLYKVPISKFGVGKQTVWIPAAAMTPRTTNGAASATTESTTNKVMNKLLDFDQTTSEGAQFPVAMPKSWNLGTVTFIPYWTAASGTGDVIWSLSGVAISNDDVIDAAFGTPQTSTDTLIATTDVHVGPESSAITIAGTPAEGDVTYFQVTRDISDTLNADARLIGIKLFYTTNVNTDD